MSIVIAIGLALLLGAGLPIQAGVNASLRSALGHPLHASIANFVIGLVVLLLLSLGIGLKAPAGDGFARTAPWMYLGGVLGSLYVIGTVVLAPRLGASTLVALIITGQLVAAIVIDHFGWLGFTAQPVSAARLFGAVLLIIGVVLVRRG